MAAARKIALFNSDVKVRAEVTDLTPGNIRPTLGEVDLILDATDNFETRYLINDFAVNRETMDLRRGCSFLCRDHERDTRQNCVPECIFPAAPDGTLETRDTAGILNSAVNLVGSIQATEAIKFLVGAHDKLRHTLLSFDVWSNDRAEVAADKPSPGCQTCEHRDFPHLAGERRPRHHALRAQFRANP